jgi:hypothetical protein
LWFKDGCNDVILLGDPKPFRRLDHYRIHEYSQKLGIGHQQNPWLGGGLHQGGAGANEAPGLVRNTPGNAKGNGVNNNNRTTSDPLLSALSKVNESHFGKVSVTASGISSVPILPGPGVIDGFFRRKRGRPPKDRLIQVIGTSYSLKFQ